MTPSMIIFELKQFKISRKFLSVKSKVDYSWKVCGLLRIFELYTALWGEAILIKATFEMHLVACPVVDLASINLVEKGQTGLHRPSMWKYCLALFTQEDIPLFSFTNCVKSFLKNHSYFLLKLRFAILKHSYYDN